jgi:hypothetical protein
MPRRRRERPPSEPAAGARGFDRSEIGAVLPAALHRRAIPLKPHESTAREIAADDTDRHYPEAVYRASGHHASRIRASHRTPCCPALYAGTARPVNIPARRSRLLPTSGICWLRHDERPRQPTDPRHPDRLPGQHERRALATRQAARRRGHPSPPGTIDAIRVIVVVGILAGVASLVADSERTSTRRSAERDNSAQNSPFTFARHRENPPTRGRRHRRHRRPPGASRRLNEQHRGGRTAARSRRSINPALDPQPGRSLDPALPGTAAAVPVTDPRRPPPQRRIPSASSPSVAAGTTAVSGFPT